MVKKLKEWLGITALENDLKKANETIKQHSRICDRLNGYINDLDKRLDTLSSFIDVSVDVHDPRNTHGHNWAVVCIRGKHTYLKLVDLKVKDARELMGILKSMQGCNTIVDAPLHLFQYYKDGMEI